MKIKHRRTLTGILILLAALCLCAAAFAEEDPWTAPGPVVDEPVIEWSVEDDVLTVTGTGPLDYQCWDSDLYYTRVVIGDGITRIGSSLFYGQETITQVSIAGSVTEIGYSAFCRCENLTKVTLNEGTASIESYAFWECKSLKKINLPDSLTSMGYGVFYECPVKFTFPIGSSQAKALGMSNCPFFLPKTSLGLMYLYDADNNCTGLTLCSVPKKTTKLTVPEGVTAIEYNALQQCASGLEYISLPASISELHTYIFSGTQRSFYIKCKKGSYAEKFARHYGLQYDNGKQKAIGYNIASATAKAQWVISSYITGDMTEREKVRMLHDWLVHNSHYDLTYRSYGVNGALVNGAGVCNSYALGMELLLTKAGIANRFMSGSANNGTGAGFQGHAWNLVRVDGQWYHLDATWDDPVGSVGRVDVDNSPVISGGEDYYYFLISDQQIGKDHRWSSGISADNNQVGSFHHNGDEYVYTAEGAFRINQADKTALFCFPSKSSVTTLTIPSSVICRGAAYTVTGIRENACGNLKKLKTLNLGSDVTAIGDSAFSGCVKLSSVKGGDAVKTIGGSAFSGCKKLSSLTLGKNVKTIGKNAFDGCVKLTTVKYAGNEKARAKIKIKAGNDALENARWKYTSKGKKAGAKPDPDKGNGTAEEPAAITAVISGAEYRLDPECKTAVWVRPEDRDAKVLKIPDKVTYEDASYKVTEIAAGACKGMKHLKEVTVGKNVKAIGKNAFSGCGKLKSVTLRTSRLETVGKNAFKGVHKKIVFRCPEKKKDACRELLQKGVPDTAKFR